MFILKKKTIVILSVFLATFFAFFICIVHLNGKTYNHADARVYKIVIDAGHGGVDAGVSGVLTGVKESDLNLSLAKRLQEYVVNAGMSAVLTRPTEAGLYGLATNSLKRKDMKKRKEIISKAQPDLVVSIHMNYFSVSSRRGAQVFFKKGDEKGVLLANSIQDSLNSMENAVRECKALSGDYYILNCSQFPSVIVECGFLSNPEDEELLVSEEYQDKLAYYIFKGAVEYLTRV